MTDGNWQTYTNASTEGWLPDDRVWALLPNQDGSLWWQPLVAADFALPSVRGSATITPTRTPARSSAA
jgi:hypothetical protein